MARKSHSRRFRVPVSSQRLFHDGDIVWTNKGWAKVTGRDRHGLLVEKLRFWSVWIAKLRKLFRKAH